MQKLWECIIRVVRIMSIADTATTLLAKFGEAVTLTHETNEVRDPATGEIITPATESVVSGFGYPPASKTQKLTAPLSSDQTRD